MMIAAGNIETAMLPSAAAGDTGLMSAISQLINEVYAAAEQGLWSADTSGRLLSR